MAKIVKTPKFRVSYPNVFTPSSFPGQEPKYGVTMLFPKAADLSALKQLAKEAIEAKWPDAATRAKIVQNPNFKNPFRDGDLEKPDTDGYKGCIFVRATSKMKPGLVDRNVQPIMSEEEFYAGCYAMAAVTAYAYSTAGNTGVAFGLQHLQFLEHGEPFSGRGKAEDMFEPLDGADAGAGTSGASAAGPAAASEVKQGNMPDFLK